MDKAHDDQWVKGLPEQVTNAAVYRVLTSA